MISIRLYFLRVTYLGLIISGGCNDLDPENYLLQDVNIAVRFIDLDSLNFYDSARINDSQTQSLYRDSLARADSSLNAALDSLGVLQIGIDTFNTTLEPLFNDLYLLYKLDSTLRIQYKFTVDSLTKQITLWNQAKSKVLNKKTRVSEIEYIHSQVTYFPEDSFSQYFLPLNIADTFSLYRIHLSKIENYTIQLRHSNQIETNALKEIFVSFDSIQLISNTFREDSASCEICLKDESPLYIFYY